MQVVTPHNELIDKLSNLGWSLKKIEFKNGVYVAHGSNEMTGQDIDRSGKTPEMATAALLSYAMRANSIRAVASQKYAAWSGDWLSDRELIAQAYSRMPAFDEKAVPAWKTLAAESKIQADAIRQQISVEIVDDPEPYINVQQMIEDVHKNKKFKVSRANAEHPIWSVEDVVNFRVVHDVLGHCQSGADFSWRGANIAASIHMPLVSTLAREALFTEVIGQAAYNSTYRGFGPKKIGFLSQFLHPVQEREGEHVWVPHGGVPQVQPAATLPPEAEQQLPTGPGQWISPVMGVPPAVMQGFEVKTHEVEAASPKSVSPNRPHDPNHFWVPPTQAPPVNPTADPESDYIDLVNTTTNAAKIDTEWWNEDPARQRLAIMNAFRVAILSPRKHIKWNAAHYQAIMHHDPATKALDLWNALEEAREHHNQALGHPEGSHLSYRKQLDYLTHELQVEDESLTPAEARKKAKEICFKKIKEFEGVIGEQAESEGKELSELRRYNMARKMLDEWLKENYSPARGWTPGQLALAKTSQWGDDSLFEMEPEDTGYEDSTGFASEDSKYGAFMGGHLDAIEAVGKHIEAIRKVALKDLEMDAGRGFLFRNTVMNMNLAGVNPKVCSFVWLLLAPMTSELGIIDTHIARGMRRSVEEVTPREYYKMERMQRAAKDATGYSHVPLGLYHWGMWDMIRNPGEHSDHSPLRVLDPLPWNSPDAKWDAAFSARDGLYKGPDAFERGRPAMEDAARDFEAEFVGQPPHQVPLATHPGA